MTLSCMEDCGLPARSDAKSYVLQLHCSTHPTPSHRRDNVGASFLRANAEQGFLPISSLD